MTIPCFFGGVLLCSMPYYFPALAQANENFVGDNFMSPWREHWYWALLPEILWALIGLVTVYNGFKVYADVSWKAPIDELTCQLDLQMSNTFIDISKPKSIYKWYLKRQAVLSDELISEDSYREQAILNAGSILLGSILIIST